MPCKQAVQYASLLRVVLTACGFALVWVESHSGFAMLGALLIAAHYYPKPCEGACRPNDRPKGPVS